MAETQKQAFRDQKRKELGEKYNISSQERDMPIRAITEPETRVEKSLWNMRAKVPGDEKGRNRKEYLEDMFKNLTGDKVIDALISQHITGLVAAESSFDNSSQSLVGAIGIMQLMPSIIASPVANPEWWPLEEVKTSYIYQVEIAKNLLRDDFTRMNKKHTQKIADAYFDGNTDDAKKHFMIWALINAYNVGEPDISTAIIAFLKKYPDKKALQKSMGVHYNENMWDDVFVFFTQFAQKSKSIKNYGHESWKYVFQAQAMTDAINAKISNTSLQPIEKKYTPIHSRLRINVLEKEPHQKTSNNSTLNDDKNLEENKKSSESSEIQKPLSKSEKIKRFYSVRAPENIEKLEGKYLSGEFGITTLPKRWQPIFNEYLEEFATKYDLKKAKTKKDFAHFPSLEIKPSDYSYQMIHVGSSDDGEKIGNGNDPDYVKLHEAWHSMIANIHERLSKKLRKEGDLSRKYTPMLTITSISRDEEYLKNLANASKNSTHMYGISVDLRMNGGILVEKKTGKEIALSWNDAKIFERALTQVLEEMRADGEIFVITEWNPPHYHLVARVDNSTSFLNRLFKKQWTPSDKHFHNNLIP